MYDDLFYQNLKKHPLTPKGKVFSVVWSILYLLMGISFFLVVIKPSNSDKAVPFILFAVQIILNFSWSFAFFKYKRIKTALLICLFMIFAVFFMILFFFKVSPVAAWLQVPYFIWLLFAFFLNYQIIKLNEL